MNGMDQYRGENEGRCYLIPKELGYHIGARGGGVI